MVYSHTTKQNDQAYLSNIKFYTILAFLMHETSSENIAHIHASEGAVLGLAAGASPGKDRPPCPTVGTVGPHTRHS